MSINYVARQTHASMLQLVVVDCEVVFGNWYGRKVVVWRIARSAVLLCRSAAVVSPSFVCSLQSVELLYARAALLPIN